MMMMKPNNLKEIFKASRVEIAEIGDKRKQRLKKYLQTKGNLFLERSQKGISSSNSAEKDDGKGRVLRTTVIVEQTSDEPAASNRQEANETVEVSNNNIITPKKKKQSPITIKRKPQIFQKLASKLMVCNAAAISKIPPPPPPPPLEEEEDVLDIATLRSNSPLMDRKRSGGTVDTSKNSEQEEDVIVHYPSSSETIISHADASTVVVSNRTPIMTRMLCHMSGDTTLREVNAWRNAALDLLLL